MPTSQLAGNADAAVRSRTSSSPARQAREAPGSGAISPELVLVDPELRRAVQDDGVLAAADEVGRPSSEPASRSERRRLTPRRLVRALSFSVLFFAGAALSAGAGDRAATLFETTTALSTSGQTDTAIPPAAATTDAEAPRVAETTAPEATESAEAPVPGEAGPPSAAPPPLESPEEGKVEPPEVSAPEIAAGRENVSAGANADTVAEGQQQAPPASTHGPPASAGQAPPAAAPEPAKTADEPARKRKKRQENGLKRSGRAGATSRPTQTTEPALREATASGGPLPTFDAITDLGLAPLPDPTPPALRLRPEFAQLLTAVSGRSRIDWALLLGVLRTNDEEALNARPLAVRAHARRLARLRKRVGLERAVAAVVGGRGSAEQALALRDYNRAIGLDALVSGLEAAKPVLVARVLRKRAIELTAEGRGDVAAGRVDVRVLAALLYLRERHGEVTVSSLRTGHRLYARPGVVSAHVYGLAVDVSALGGRAIAGDRRRGGVTEQAVYDLLYLPGEVAPQEIISLFDLGGASFALADHWDHVHIGYGAPDSSEFAGAGRAVADASLVDLWKGAGARYGIPWQVLAAINKIESNFGRNMGPSSAGAIGWMQFLPSTWERWGVDADGNGVADPWNAHDAIYSAARYLAGAGARHDLRRAIFAYNHANWYVEDVLETARAFGWR